MKSENGENLLTNSEDFFQAISVNNVPKKEEIMETYDLPSVQPVIIICRSRDEENNVQQLPGSNVSNNAEAVTEDRAFTALSRVASSITITGTNQDNEAGQSTCSLNFRSATDHLATWNDPRAFLVPMLATRYRNDHMPLMRYLVGNKKHQKTLLLVTAVTSNLFYIYIPDWKNGGDESIDAHKLRGLIERSVQSLDASSSISYGYERNLQSLKMFRRELGRCFKYETDMYEHFRDNKELDAYYSGALFFSQDFR